MAEVLYRTTFLESRGTGAKRILDVCKAHNVPEPTWSVDGGFVCVTFKRRSAGSGKPIKRGKGSQYDLNRTPVRTPVRTQVGPK